MNYNAYFDKSIFTDCAKDNKHIFLFRSEAGRFIATNYLEHVPDQEPSKTNTALVTTNAQWDSMINARALHEIFGDNLDEIIENGITAKQVDAVKLHAYRKDPIIVPNVLNLATLGA